MACTRLLWCKRRELSFPISQDVSLDSEQTADFADPKIQLVRNVRRIRLDGNIHHQSSVILAQNDTDVTVKLLPEQGNEVLASRKNQCAGTCQDGFRHGSVNYHA